MSKSKATSKSVARSDDDGDDDRKSVDLRSSSDNRRDGDRHDRDEGQPSKRGKSNSDDDKHDGRGHGDGDHNDDGHSDNGRGSSTKSHGSDDHDDDHGDRSNRDMKRSDSSSKRNNDDDKHDGRGHGDGDHNDDGHSDNGRGSSKKEAEAAANAEKLVLETRDAHDVEAGQRIAGSRDNDGLVGGKGNDQVFGMHGDDTLVGDRVGNVTVDLNIAASLSNGKDPDAVSLLIANMPAGATLSAGSKNADGTWTLSLGDLGGLKLTAPDASNFTLKATATATDGSGLSQSAELNVTLNDGNADLLVGGKGNDTLSGGQGDDMMFGGSMPTAEAKPHVATYADNDTLFAGDGNDKVWGNSGDDSLFGETGNDVLLGGKGGDVLVGGDGDDVVRGNTGDDHVMADEGNDRYEGNAGFDTLDFSGAKGGMSIDLSKKTAVGMGNDTFSGFEMVVGSSFDDRMKGSKHSDAMAGGDGNDNLRGLGGADTLTGGDGRDTFVYTKKDAADGTADTITDFSKEDMLDLHDFFKGQKGSIDQVVAVKDDGMSSHIYAKMGADMVEIAVLEGFSGFAAAELLKAGMILT